MCLWMSKLNQNYIELRLHKNVILKIFIMLNFSMEFSLFEVRLFNLAIAITHFLGESVNCWSLKIDLGYTTHPIWTVGDFADTEFWVLCFLFNPLPFSVNVLLLQMDDDLEKTIENLYPALTECFAVIICGWVASSS